MDTMQAFARGQASRNNPMKTFDWDKAAELIKEMKPERAVAGLKLDMEWTSDTIYENNQPIKNCSPFLISTWAIPVLAIDEEEIPCWKYQEEADEVWPQSSLDILNI